jgi:predicted dehydrogenase
VLKEPKFVECHRLGMFGGRGADVDVVLDLMIHDIDLILSFVRSSVARIHAVGVPVISPNIDIANARLSFANGCVANVTASRVSVRKQRKIRIFQEDAYVSMDFVEHNIQIYRRIFPQGKDGTPEITGELLETEKGDALRDER